jgi:hypothetical protein
MPPKFRHGAIAYAKDGRFYTVDEVADGIVYCVSATGAETEFPETHLQTEQEWNARSDGRRGTLYVRLKQARAYTASPGKFDKAAAEAVLAKVERLTPGILDFTAFTIAREALPEMGDQDLLSSLSVPQCREVFESVKPEVRAVLLANILGTPPDILVGAGRLGDNLMRAMLEKGLTGREASYETFRARAR